MTERNIGFATRQRTYTLVVGAALGMLVAGLLIPFVFGTPLHRRSDTAVKTFDQTDGDTTVFGDAAGDGATDGSAVDGSADLSPAGIGTSATLPLTTGGASGATKLAATDRGVTAESINVAFLLVDLGGVAQFGFSVPGYDPESQKRFVMAYVDDINTHGGILGRKIVPEFFKYDPTNRSSGPAACRSATQDNAVFAVVDVGAGLDFPSQLCITDQNHTPLVEYGGFGTTKELYEKSAGRLVTVLPSGIRMLANTGQEVHARGLLKGKTIGLVDRDFEGTVQTVTDGLVTVLDKLGYKLAYRADLSSDDGVAASQIPVTVQQMRAHGVDTIFLLTDFIVGTEFVSAADRGGYTPDYLVSDFEQMITDVSVSAMPPSFRATGITTTRIGEWRVNMGEPAIDASCRKTYAASSGMDPKRSDNEYQGALHACGMIDVLRRALTGAGATLTRDGFVSSVQQIGPLASPFFGGASYGRGKFDGADDIRSVAFDAGCKCWMPNSGFKRPYF
jgi:hypothetical protein